MEENIVCNGVTGADKEQRIARTAELLEVIGLKIVPLPSIHSFRGQKQGLPCPCFSLKPLHIADEPTANLDTEAAETLLNTMLLLNEKERSLSSFQLTITCDEQARRLITLEDGRITKDETYVR